MSGNIEEMARNAEKGSIRLAGASGEARNRALKAMAQALDENRDRIFAANKKDLDAAVRWYRKAAAQGDAAAQTALVRLGKR